MTPPPSPSLTFLTNFKTKLSIFFLSSPVKSFTNKDISDSNHFGCNENNSENLVAGSGDKEDDGKYWIVGIARVGRRRERPYSKASAGERFFSELTGGMGSERRRLTERSGI